MVSKLPEPQWLFRRLKSEQSNLEPSYSRRATVGWIRGLSILCAERFEREVLLSKLRGKVKSRNPANDSADTTVCEYTYMALQNLSSLYVMKDAGRAHDLARVAIVSWYYGVYFAAKSMIAAYDGSKQDTHARTAKTWDQQIVQRHLITSPFSFRLSTLVKKEYEIEVEELGATFHIGTGIPSTEEEALGACLAYLKGTADHEREKAEVDLKGSKEFKKLGVKNFRKTVAREMRDKRLSGKTVCFLNQAFRYRGKANYRDAIYLTYGNVKEEVLDQFLEDLYITLQTFVLASTCYCELRVKEKCWVDFIEDLEKHGRLALPLEFLE